MTATAGFALATMDNSFFTQALGPMTQELQLTPQLAGNLTSIIYVVAGFATYGVGLLMDRIGRRRAFQLTLVGTAAGSLLTAFAWAYVPLVAFRPNSNGAGSAEGITVQRRIGAHVENPEKQQFVGDVSGGNSGDLGVVVGGGHLDDVGAGDMQGRQ